MRVYVHQHGRGLGEAEQQQPMFIGTQIMYPLLPVSTGSSRNKQLKHSAIGAHPPYCAKVGRVSAPRALLAPGALTRSACRAPPQDPGPSLARQPRTEDQHQRPSWRSPSPTARLRFFFL